MDSKQHLPCFCRYYGANLEYFSALWCGDPGVVTISQPNVKNKRSYFAYKNHLLGKNELWLSTWESRE
jgi:hypothetical protein